MNDDGRMVLEDLGRAIVLDGRLKQLQTRLQFSANSMAEMLHVSPTTYRGWTSTTPSKPWPELARRIGEFYRDALDMLGLLRAEGTNIDDYMPLTRVAMEVGWPHEVLMRHVRAGTLIADDFEVLGLWVPRTEVNRLRGERHHRVAA